MVCSGGSQRERHERCQHILRLLACLRYLFGLQSSQADPEVVEAFTTTEHVRCHDLGRVGHQHSHRHCGMVFPARIYRCKVSARDFSPSVWWLNTAYQSDHIICSFHLYFAIGKSSHTLLHRTPELTVAKRFYGLCRSNV